MNLFAGLKVSKETREGTVIHLGDARERTRGEGTRAVRSERGKA